MNLLEVEACFMQLWFKMNNKLHVFFLLKIKTAYKTKERANALPKDMSSPLFQSAFLIEFLCPKISLHSNLKIIKVQKNRRRKKLSEKPKNKNKKLLKLKTIGSFQKFPIWLSNYPKYFQNSFLRDEEHLYPLGVYYLFVKDIRFKDQKG